MKLKKYIIPIAVSVLMLQSANVYAEDDYIILLPNIEGVTYGLDQEHVSEQYSTDVYTVLLYSPGEEVEISVKGNPDFSIMDVLEQNQTDYAEGAMDGNVSFFMPEEDLNLFFADEDTTANTAESSSPAVSEVTQETEVLADNSTEEQYQTEETEETQETEVTEQVTMENTPNQTEITQPQDISEESEESDNSIIKVSSSSVYIRSNASTGSSSKGMLKTGQRVLVTQTEGDWSKIKYAYKGMALDGFVKSDLLLDLSALYTATTDTEIKESADDSAKTIATLKTGEEIVVLEQGQGKWVKVKYVKNGYPKDAFVRTDTLILETDPEIDPVLS